MLSRILLAPVLLAAAPLAAQTVVNPTPATPAAPGGQIVVAPSVAPRVVTATPQAQNITVVQQQTSGDVLRAGAPVPVALSQALTTKGKALKVGQIVQLEVAQDVLLNGRVVIPARSPVEGVLTHVRNKGMWGKSGAIQLAIKSVKINGTSVRLKGDMDSRGDTGTAGVVGAVVAMPLAGFFVTGTSAEMPLNMPGRAFLDEDIALAPAQ
jgi:hypothetical protein